jgi:hypothetical protein
MENLAAESYYFDEDTYVLSTAISSACFFVTSSKFASINLSLLACSVITS